MSTKTKDKHKNHAVSYQFVSTGPHAARLYCHYCEQHISWAKAELAELFQNEFTGPVVMSDLPKLMLRKMHEIHERDREAEIKARKAVSLNHQKIHNKQQAKIDKLLSDLNLTAEEKAELVKPVVHKQPEPPEIYKKLIQSSSN